MTVIGKVEHERDRSADREDVSHRAAPQGLGEIWMLLSPDDKELIPDGADFTACDEVLQGNLRCIAKATMADGQVIEVRKCGNEYGVRLPKGAASRKCSSCGQTVKNAWSYLGQASLCGCNDLASINADANDLVYFNN